MLIYSKKWTYFSNEYCMEAWVLMSVLDVIYQRFLYMLLLQIEYCSWFYDIIWYILFSISSWPMISTQYLCLYWPPTCMFLSLLFVECSKRTVVFNSTATLASLHYIGFQGELTLLAWSGSSSSCLDALKFRHGLAFYVF